jgi:hypothetical protein
LPKIDCIQVGNKGKITRFSSGKVILPMSLNLSPVINTKSVIITSILTVLSLIYKAVDAASNVEFLLLKLNVHPKFAEFLGSARTIDIFVALERKDQREHRQ